MCLRTGIEASEYIHNSCKTFGVDEVKVFCSNYGVAVTQYSDSNPGKGHWWTTGRASGPNNAHCSSKKSQLTIGRRPSSVKTGSV